MSSYRDKNFDYGDKKAVENPNWEEAKKILSLLDGMTVDEYRVFNYRNREFVVSRGK